jgi:hypothetical protein
MGRHREFPVEKRSHHHTITPPSDGYLAGLRVQWCYGLMEKTRDRTLSGDELRAIWAATGGDGDYARIVRLCTPISRRSSRTSSQRRRCSGSTMRVLDLVGDACGQLTERGKLLRLHETVLCGAQILQ